MKHVLILHLLAASLCAADESASRQVQIKKWNDFYRAEAEAHTMEIGTGNHIRTLKLHNQPLLRYANPAGGGDGHGQFFAWMDKGRPVVIATIWSKINDDEGRERRIIHSMHTLSNEAIVDELREEIFWTPNGNQVFAQPLVDAPKPAVSKRLRLTQMRRLAREFEAIEMKRRPTDKKRLPYKLRLQPEPMLRFEAPSRGVIDGALFAMFIDWDPDLVLLLEAKETDSGRKWHFTTVPFTAAIVRVKRKGREWEHDAEMRSELTDAYRSVHGVSYQPAVLK